MKFTQLIDVLVDLVEASSLGQRTELVARSKAILLRTKHRAIARVIKYPIMLLRTQDVCFRLLDRFTPSEADSMVSPLLHEGSCFFGSDF